MDLLFAMRMLPLAPGTSVSGRVCNASCDDPLRNCVQVFCHGGSIRCTAVSCGPLSCKRAAGDHYLRQAIVSLTNFRVTPRGISRIAEMSRNVVIQGTGTPAESFAGWVLCRCIIHAVLSMAWGISSPRGSH